MKKAKLIIVGDSAFAEIAYEYFTYDSEYEVVAFSVEKSFLKKRELFGLPIVPFEDLEKEFDPQKCKAFVAVTYRNMNRVRARLYNEAKKKGFSIASYISSEAFVWRNVEIGENCFIFEDNVVQPFVKIGSNVILWSGNHIGHHSIIGDHCFIASHVVISGFVKVGKYCFMGVNATIANNLEIGENSLIGAGAMILKNAEGGKVYGSKMTKIKKYSSFEYFKVSENE